MTDDNGKRVHKTVHILVAMAFLEHANDLVVNHIDHNPLNNHVSNLEVISQQDNSNCAVNMGRIKTKPVCQFDEDHKFVDNYPSCREAGRQSGVNFGTIIQVCKRSKVNLTAGSYLWRYTDECKKIDNHDTYEFID